MTDVRYTRFDNNQITDVQPEKPRDEGTQSAHRNATSTAVKDDRLSLVVYVLLLSLALPFYYNIGPIRLSPYRFVLVVMTLPMLFLWVSGRFGGFKTADFLLLLTSIWAVISLQFGLQASSPQYAAVSFIELFTPYLIARYYVRSYSQWKKVYKFLWLIALILLPAAVIEARTGYRLYNSLFSFLPTHAWANYGMRLGMNRAQTVFEHPILCGVFIAAIFAPAYVIFRNKSNIVSSLAKTFPVVSVVFFSLSSGAFVCLNLQVILLMFNKMMSKLKARWWIFPALVLTVYIVIDLLSNRTPFQVLSTYLALNSHTAYWRVLIAEYGMQSVWDNPIFGLGISSDWERPHFMVSSSVDNFWLLQAMRFGIPGFILMAMTWISVYASLSSLRQCEKHVAAARDSAVISIIAISFAIATVHIWGSTFILVMFVLGASMWVSDQKTEKN